MVGLLTEGDATILSASQPNRHTSGTSIRFVTLNLFHGRAIAANDLLTDRRQKRALAANPASDDSGDAKLRRWAAVRCSAWFGENSQQFLELLLAHLDVSQNLAHQTNTDSFATVAWHNCRATV
jgi:hypothetical protein